MNFMMKPFQAEGVAELKVKRAAVIGAGSMGAGIAAQFANAGVPVDLLDLPGKDAASRCAPAEAGIERQLKMYGFMVPEAAELVSPGNIEDHLTRLATADWIVEAVIEDLEIKRDLYARIDTVRKAGSIVSSNTSTIPRAELITGGSPEFRRDFVITHFFNPPRIMRLVELVCAKETAAEVVDAVTAACRTALGKTVVNCRDTPGFIANRIGCFWMAVAIKHAIEAGLSVEEVDAVNSAMGIPRTGVFGLIDLIGIDLIPHVWGSLMHELPHEDRLYDYNLPAEPLIKNLIEAGRYGRKANAGFYRRAPDKSLEALDLISGEYRPSASVSPEALAGGGRNLSALLDANDKFGDYAWRVFSEVFLYSCEHGSTIAADIGAIDTAIRLGYGWREGPFQLAERYGLSVIAERLGDQGETVPPLLTAAIEAGGFHTSDGQPLGTDGSFVAPAEIARPIALSSTKAKSAAIVANDAASLWDLGDGIACLEAHTKMNSLAPGVFEILEQALDRGGSEFSGLVIGNDHSRAFSVGADLGFISNVIENHDWKALDSYIARGQDLFLAMKYTDFPVVAAAHGLALGGGCEIMLHAGAIVAHAELLAGLPETRVGIVPGWGGCTQLLVRAQEAGGGTKGAAISTAAFDTIFKGASSISARDALAKGILRPGDLIAMNRDELLSRAKSVAQDMAAAGHTPPRSVTLHLGGPPAKAEIMRSVHASETGSLTQTDGRVADILAEVLTGGPSANPATPLSEADIMLLERQAVLELAKLDKVRQRIRHMLETGRPLKN